MEIDGKSSLQPRSLAWVESAGGGDAVPVVWFGCLHGRPTRLMVGLRASSWPADQEVGDRRFSLCWVPSGKDREDSARKDTMRLRCRHGRVIDAYGTVTLYGQLEEVAIGRRILSGAQVDFFRLLEVSCRADT